MDSRFTRRSLIATTPLAASLAATGAIAAPLHRSGSARRIDDTQVGEMLRDPEVRARVQARVRGSCARETVPIFYRLDIYGFTGDGNIVPYFTLNHLSVNEWTPLPGDLYEAKTFECGVYCRFGTDEALDEWVNPVTGEVRKVWQFLGGPFTVVTGPDGLQAKGAELTPQPARMEAFGGQFFLTSSASMARSNPTAPQDHPEFFSGTMAYWDTVSTVIANAQDAFDDTLTSAPAICHFQNLGMWHPWMGMGKRQGRTYGRAIGTKLTSLDQIPAAARKTLEDKTPLIFDRANWQAPHFDIPEYIKSL